MFNVGSYTLSPSKVVWKDIATDFAAAVLEPQAPVVLSAHTAMEVACESADEAHYLCALLNSASARTFVASYVATHISTHTVSTIVFPKFDPHDSAHRELAAASQAAHSAAAAEETPDQSRVDDAAAALWGVSAADIRAMQAYLEQLHKRDLGLSDDEVREGDEPLEDRA
jgi:hypothetical protein